MTENFEDIKKKKDYDTGALVFSSMSNFWDMLDFTQGVMTLMNI